MTEKTILLARPSAYIVAEMKELLSRNGYSAYVVDDIDDIANAPSSTKGVIVSTAISSGVGSLDDIIASVRQHLPSAPLAFTTLQSFDSAVQLLTPKLKSFSPESAFIQMNKDFVSDRDLGGKNGYLIMQKQNLVDADNAKYCDQIIKRHFI